MPLLSYKIKTFAQTSQARDAFYNADRNNDDSLDFQEFRAEYSKEYPSANEDDITYKFFDIDVDGDGLITFEETQDYFSKNGGKKSLMQQPGLACVYKCSVWYTCLIKSSGFCGNEPYGCNCI